MAIAAWPRSLLGWGRDLSALTTRLAPQFQREELEATAGAVSMDYCRVLSARPAG